MKKMLITISSLVTGGSEKSLVNFINQYKENFNITLLVYSEKGDYYSQFLGDIDIRYFLKNNENINKKRIINRLFKYLPARFCNKMVLKKVGLENEKYDIEFAYMEGESSKIIAGSENKNSLKLTYLHCDFSENWYSKYAYKNKKEEKEVYSKFDNILAVSEPQKKSFEEIFELTGVEVVPNFINKEEILSKGNEKIEFSNIKYFCAVGRLVEVKRFDLLIEAFSIFRKDNPEYKLLILGEGYLYDELKRLVEKLGEAENILLLGFRENPYKYIKNSVGLIQTSSSESFGYVLAEAALLGVPVLATKTQGSEYMKKYFDIIGIEDTKQDIVKNLKLVLNKENKTIFMNMDINKNIKIKFSKLLNSNRRCTNLNE